MAVDFHLDEIITSRTDKRGVIQSCNAVFQRVSVYEWGELLGAPHRVLRHPSMPKGVFQLMWDTLKADEPFGGYIENKQKDGGSYKVFAFVTPTQDGYISIRVKPTSNFLASVEAIYADLVTKEKEEGLTPEESRDLLIERIKELGFSSYENFFTTALEEENRLRDEGLGRKKDFRGAQVARAKAEWTKVPESCSNISKSYLQISETAQNLQIQTVHLGSSGQPLAVIARQFSATANDLNKMLIDFTETSKMVSDSLQLTIHCFEAASLTKEFQEHFDVRSVNDGPEAKAEELAAFNQVLDRYENDAMKQLVELSAHVSGFKKLFGSVEDALTSLNVTRVMCQIETSSLERSTPGIETAISELEQFIDTATDMIKTIRRALNDVETLVRTCIEASHSKETNKAA